MQSLNSQIYFTQKTTYLSYIIIIRPGRILGSPAGPGRILGTCVCAQKPAGGPAGPGFRQDQHFYQ